MLTLRNHGISVHILAYADRRNIAPKYEGVCMHIPTNRHMWYVHTHTHTHTHHKHQDSPLLGEVELKETSGEPFAVLAAEFVFTYGMFGYGESFQVELRFAFLVQKLYV